MKIRSMRAEFHFFYRFSKNSQIVNFLKIRSMGVEFHVERQTDRQS